MMVRSTRARRAGTLALACVALAGVNPAGANGAFPDEFSIHFPADAPHRMYLGANFGLLVSEDDGLTWRYACEPWVVAGSNAALANSSVSFYQVAADGAILASAINLTRSADVACTWPDATGSISGQTLADFFPDPNDATFVVANVILSDKSYIVASHDGGKTFAAAHLYDTPDLLTGVEIARSKRGVMYAASVSTTGGPAKFVASTDSGATWGPPTVVNIPAATEPRILAVDPVDEKKVYLRILGAITDSILMTADGGQTFQTVLPPVEGKMSAFLRATDGTLYAGTRSGTLYVKPPASASFTGPLTAPHLRCLGQRPGSSRIYACTDLVADGYSLASSDDSGQSFQRVMSFKDLLGPLTCAPVQTNCAAHWDRIKSVLGIGSPDGGSPDGGSGGSPSGGSHCATAGVAVWSILFLALAAARRGLRRRGSPRAG